MFGKQTVPLPDVQSSDALIYHGTSEPQPSGNSKEQNSRVKTLSLMAIASTTKLDPICFLTKREEYAIIFSDKAVFSTG